MFFDTCKSVWKRGGKPAINIGVGVALLDFFAPAANFINDAILTGLYSSAAVLVIAYIRPTLLNLCRCK